MLYLNRPSLFVQNNDQSMFDKVGPEKKKGETKTPEGKEEG